MDIENYDSQAEYLRKACGMEVTEREEGQLDIVGASSYFFGREVKTIITVHPNDVGAIVGDAYRSGRDIQDVFDEYVQERRTEIEGDPLTDEEIEEIQDKLEES